MTGSFWCGSWIAQREADVDHQTSQTKWPHVDPGRRKGCNGRGKTVAGVEIGRATVCYRIIVRSRRGSSRVVDEADGTSPAGRGGRVV
ncbi:hypothetical protein IAQ61_011694 [Plenodomus lingam]|uniref:uncharacterized protein n=1 Tax=Leptosphaeria maculans TaxID=5022 RepID=UPI003330CB08|nr:hypothetical protein IAQ61_011694 [Plenodomus lingam]